MTNKKFNTNKVREIAHQFMCFMIGFLLALFINRIVIPTFISNFVNPHTPTNYEISYGETIYLHDISIEDIDLRNSDKWFLVEKVDDDSVSITMTEEIDGSCCILINNVATTIDFV